MIDSRLSIGPFFVRVQSDVHDLAVHLNRMYTGYSVVDRGGSHFDITIAGTPGVRRWVRRQANVIINGARPFLPLPSDLSAAAFEWALNWCVGNQAHRWVAIHAAVVEHDGRAVILSGPSGSGKSTLCAALTIGGWRLLSDEFALLDPVSGRLMPLPRPVSLKEDAIEIARARAPRAVFGREGLDIEGHRFIYMQPPAASVRRAADTALPACVLIPRYTAGARTTVETLSKARTLLALTDQSFNYSYLGAKGYECIAELVGRCSCHALEYGDLDEAVTVIQQELTATLGS